MPHLIPFLLLACTGAQSTPDTGATQDTACIESSWYADGDRDGFGAGAATWACTAPEGAVDNADDCDDSSAAVHPGAVELCDGIDNDCDGEVDPPSSADAVACFRDADGDGYGDEDQVVVYCECTGGLTEQGGDCLDTDSDVHPGAPETWYDGTDADCAGDDDYDADADGYRAEDYYDGSDCLDSDAAVNPGAYDLCDNDIDDDCDGLEPGCGLEGHTPAADADLWIENPVPNAVFGGVATVAGDSDGDGCPEVLVALDGEDEQGAYGEAWLLELRAPPPGESRHLDADELRLARFVTPDAEDLLYGVHESVLTQHIANADLDGDGTPDYVLAATRGDDSEQQSRIDLWYGPPSEDMDLEDAATFRPADPILQVGGEVLLTVEPTSHESWQIAAARATYDDNPREGAAVYFLEATHFDGGSELDDAVQITPSEADEFESGINLEAGDLNGDGVSDLLFGHQLVETVRETHSYTSTTLVFLGPFDADRSTDDADVVVDEDGLYDGTSDPAEASAHFHTLLPDLDGSAGGVTRLAVASPSFDGAEGANQGAVHLFTWSGTSSVWTSTDANTVLSGPPGSYAGTGQLSWGGDLDADGLVELVVPAVHPTADSDEGGGIYVVEPPLEGTAELLSSSDAVVAGSDGESVALGWQALSGFDLDGDSTDDLLLWDGDWRSTDDEQGRGALFRGGTGGF